MGDTLYTLLLILNAASFTSSIDLSVMKINSKIKKNRSLDRTPLTDNTTCNILYSTVIAPIELYQETNDLQHTAQKTIQVELQC